MVRFARPRASAYVRLTSPRGSVTAADCPRSPPGETVATLTPGDIPPVSPAPLAVSRSWYAAASVPANRTSHPPPGAAVTRAFPDPTEDSPWRAVWTAAADALYAIPDV